MNDKGWLFVTAAKGLQGYVFRSDPLKEMTGGSELIELLPRTQDEGRSGAAPRRPMPLLPRTQDEDYLAKVLARMEMQGNHDVLTDASGAARILFQEEADARHLALLWPLLVSQFAPGLEVTVSVVPVNGNLGDAIEKAEREINIHRNLPSAALPEAGPWVARNRRTGLPAAAVVEALDEEERNQGRMEPVDAESRRKRQAAHDTSKQTLLKKVVSNQDLLASGTSAERKQFDRRWPSNLTKLADSDNSYLAIIHADANGLGAAMMACIAHLKTASSSGQAAKTYEALCRAIEDASKTAAQAAMNGVIEKTLKRETDDNLSGTHRTLPIPVRPIICAGEDFTCVIQAKHAVQFAQDYLLALEQETEKRFKLVAGGGYLPEAIPDLQRLTACAGIVFCKSHFPFSRAYAIAEQLCAHAKKRTDRQRSAITFLRLRSSLLPSDDYSEIVNHAFRCGSGAGPVLLTMNPYVVDDSTVNDLALLSHLRALMKAMDTRLNPKLPRSGLRELVSRAYESKAAADQAFGRLKLVVSERDKETWERLETALATLTRNGLWKQTPDGHATPLFDALELLHLER
jgi:hypothetical protein